MHEKTRSGCRHYRLAIDHGSRPGTDAIEFEADGLQGLLYAADRLGAGRNVAIFEDGRPLVRVRTMSGAGYWLINPPALLPPHD